MTDFDYIIVGAGSAGCVLADRLTEDGKNTVLLLEAGGADNSLFIKMPTALSYPMNNKKYNWYFATEPEPGLDARRLDCPRGKVLGGSSSINGMVYVRGHAGDFDQWQSLGAKGWAYQDCQPYFKRLESWQGKADSWRGNDGAMVVGSGNEMKLNPLYQAFVNAGSEAGYPTTADYNGYQQEGFGAMQMTVDHGVRCSTSRAYLSRAKKRHNLTVLTKVLVNKVVVKDKVAVGVEYQQGKKLKIARANKEVLLSSGSIGSPVLLQLSGIGPVEVLDKAGVEVVHALPGVGENLQDHLEVYFQFHCKKPITLNGKLGLISKGLIGARWLLFKNGLGSSNHFEACGFIRSKAGVKWPDIQYHFLPAAMRYDGSKALEGHGFQVHVGPNKPLSRGRVKITSSDPKVKPSILFNYLQHPQDREDWRRCIRLTREIIQQGAMDEYRGEEVQPGLEIQSDEQIDDWVKANVESAYHPSCSCKMGALDDELAVVDPQCKVRGISQLRVVDSSIMPSITNANLNAPTIMIAEKAADMILGRKPLPVSNLQSWFDPQWQSQQRQKPPLREVTQSKKQ